MIIFLLIITMLFFIDRILTTPRYLSKKIYEQFVISETDRIREDLSRRSLECNQCSIKLLKIFSFIVYIIFILYYTYISYIIQNELIYVLSLMQIGTVIINMQEVFNKELYSFKPEDYIFYRWCFLFNVILDYIYYPMVIYLLLK